jgi:hypothetical protein
MTLIPPGGYAKGVNGVTNDEENQIKAYPG